MNIKWVALCVLVLTMLTYEFSGRDLTNSSLVFRHGWEKKNELQTSLTHQHRIHVWYVYSVIYIYIYTKIYVPIYQYVYTSSINPLGLCIPQVQFNKTLTH